MPAQAEPPPAQADQDGDTHMDDQPPAMDVNAIRTPVCVVRLRRSRAVTINVAVNEDPYETQLPLAQPTTVQWEQRELTPEEIQTGHEKEFNSMTEFNVYAEILKSELSKDQVREIIDCRWVDRLKPDGTIRCRLVCRGFKEEINSVDDVYASTPTLSRLKIVLIDALNRNRVIYTGDISTAFLHAEMLKEILIKPPSDFIPARTAPRGDSVIWKLLKAMCCPESTHSLVELPDDRISSRYSASWNEIARRLDENFLEHVCVKEGR